MFRNCAAVFDIDPEMLSQEEIIAAGEMAITCLHNFKQHSVGINVLRKQGWSTHTRTYTRTYSSTFFSVPSCTLYLAKFMSTCTRTYLSTVTKNPELMSTLQVPLSTFF